MVSASRPSLPYRTRCRVPLLALSRYRVALNETKARGNTNPPPRYTPRRQHQLPRGKASKHRCSQIQGNNIGLPCSKASSHQPTWSPPPTTWQHVATRSLQASFTPGYHVAGHISAASDYLVASEGHTVAGGLQMLVPSPPRGSTQANPHTRLPCSRASINSAVD